MAVMVWLSAVVTTDSKVESLKPRVTITDYNTAHIYAT